MALIGWWKFNDSLNAEVGTNCSAQNGYTAVYSAAKFYNGLDITTQPTFGQRVVMSFVPPVNGTLEFWFKQNGWSWTNTTVSDSRYHIPISLTGGAPLQYVQYEYGTGLVILMQDQAARQVSATINNITLNADTLYHLAYTWGAGGFNVYIDGSSVYSGSMGSCAFDGTTTMTSQLLTDWINGARWFNGWMDNLKIYNTQRTDFSDRFYEDGVIPPAITTYLNIENKIRSRLTLTGISAGRTASTTNYLKNRHRTRIDLTGISAG